jgi:hypothetical protein
LEESGAGHLNGKVGGKVAVDLAVDDDSRGADVPGHPAVRAHDDIERAV